MSYKTHFLETIEKLLTDHPYVEKNNIKSHNKNIGKIFDKAVNVTILDPYFSHSEGKTSQEDNLTHFQNFCAFVLEPNNQKPEPILELEVILQYFAQLLNSLKDPDRLTKFKSQHFSFDVEMLFIQCIMLGEQQGPLRKDIPFNSKTFLALYSWIKPNQLLLRTWEALYIYIIELLGFFDTHDLSPVDPITSEQANTLDNKGQTALHYAAKLDCPVAAAHLISKGANPNFPNKNEQHPLDLALEHHQFTTAQVLFKQGACCSATYLKQFYLETAPDKEGNTWLHYLAMLDSNIIQNFSLLNYSRDLSFLNFKNNAGVTALHLAVSQQNENFVEKIISHPALDKSPLDDQEHTPLYYAILGDNQSISEALIDAGAKLSKMDLLREDPVHQVNLLQAAEKLERGDRIIETIRAQMALKTSGPFYDLLNAFFNS